MREHVSLGHSSSEIISGAHCGEELAKRLTAQGGNCVIISDTNVEAALRPNFPLLAEWLTVPAGEASKSLESVSGLWSKMIGLGLDRSTKVVAVGGGVVGDLAGFVAATFMRGVDFYSIPTTLLAMVDASVGGKVGIDLPEGKNLVGQFYPAQVVAIDSQYLQTLPLEEWSNGMAEVIKHGVLAGGELWNSLQDLKPGDILKKEKISELVDLAVGVKLRVVQEDPFEKTGLRATLNLGHTYGHAMEWCSKYKMGHGQAVSLGLLAGLRLSRNLGLLEPDFEPELCKILRAWSLPIDLQAWEKQWEWDDMTLALGRDKKNRDGQWCFVLPQALGEMKTVVGPDLSAVREAYFSLSTAGCEK